jgi:hypothetical protein
MGHGGGRAVIVRRMECRMPQALRRNGQDGLPHLQSELGHLQEDRLLDRDREVRRRQPLQPEEILIGCHRGRTARYRDTVISARGAGSV